VSRPLPLRVRTSLIYDVTSWLLAIYRPRPRPSRYENHAVVYTSAQCYNCRRRRVTMMSPNTLEILLVLMCAINKGVYRKAVIYGVSRCSNQAYAVYYKPKQLKRKKLMNLKLTAVSHSLQLQNINHFVGTQYRIRAFPRASSNCSAAIY